MPHALIRRFREWNRVRRARVRPAAFCMIATRDFLPWAVVLIDAIRRHHPDAVVALLHVSRDRSATLPVMDHVNVISSSALLEPAEEAALWARYTNSEFCFALKPRLLR